MITKSISIKIFDNPDQAPNYKEDTKIIQGKACLIVQGGTTTGKPTIDFQFEDADGNKYLMMTTGALMSMIAGAMAGVELREEDKKKQH